MGSQANRFEMMREKAKTNEAKGKYGGDCNVTQCQKEGACSYNTAMRAYYCKDCANKINEASQRFEGVELCQVLEDHSHLLDGELNNNKNLDELTAFLRGTKNTSVMQPWRRVDGKTGRNEKCPCGSNLKYKKCCLQNGA